MSIAARCADCGKGYKVADEWAGKRIRCKACGGVIQIPGTAGGAPAAAAAKPAPGRPAKARAATAAASSIDDDPFNNLDSLLELEQGGAVQDAHPPTARRAQSAPPPPPLPPLAPAPARGPRAAPLNYGGGNAPAYTPRDDNPYVTLPAEDLIDKWLPLLCVGIFVAFMLVLGKRAISDVTEMGQSLGASEEQIGKAVRKIVGYMSGFTASPFIILAPLCLLGVFIGSRIMKFALPPLAYWRCAAVACTPFALSISLNQFDAGKSMLSAGWWLGTPVTIGVLWLLFRLKPVPFAVTAPLTAATMLGIPYLLASMLGYVKPTTSADRWRDQPRRPDPAPRVAIPSPDTPTNWPPKPPAPGSPATAEKLEADRTRTRNALTTVGVGLRVYANANKGIFPQSLSMLKGTDPVQDNDLRNTRGIEWNYSWFPTLGPNSPGRIMVAHDRIPLSDGTRAVLFADGSVEFVEPAKFGQVMSESTRLKMEAARARRGQNP